MTECGISARIEGKGNYKILITVLLLRAKTRCMAAPNRAECMLKGSPLWRLFRRVGFLRSSLYLSLELKRALLEARDCRPEVVDRDFLQKTDPWNYRTSPLEQRRMQRMLDVVDSAAQGTRYVSALEIGCAEGLFTQVLAERSASLLVIDISAVALDRARGSREWSNEVHFQQADLRGPSPLPGTFDLIVVAGVLEYFNRPSTFRAVREKLVRALNPGGHLLIETTRTNDVVEMAWWGRLLIRGKWINSFIAAHEDLALVSHISEENYVISLLKRTT